ncbi:unnamed protein product [Prorocentrum cordatum]|uniref:Eukaryotic translation initiation factor 3 30 kDa subunit n=1 Tax=Prorocentrum cordatum TaxID=2364126 RepID=A0ABN9VM10_9DINO|nr:unnamed protein product [Polarella glacialis]
MGRRQGDKGAPEGVLVRRGAAASKPAPKAAAKAFEPAARAAEKKEEDAKKPTAAEPDAVVITKNSFEDLECNRQADVDKLCQLVVKKLKTADAKHAKAKFLHDIIRGMQGKITLPEAESLHKTCKDLWTKRKKVEDAKEKAKAEEETQGKKAELEQQEVADDDFFASFM